MYYGQFYEHVAEYWLTAQGSPFTQHKIWQLIKYRESYDYIFSLDEYE